MPAPQPDAKEKFMECKRAYQALSDSRERMRYDQRRNGVWQLWCPVSWRAQQKLPMTCIRGWVVQGGAPGGFSWDDVVSSGERGKKAAEEAFYGIGDFFR